MNEDRRLDILKNECYDLRRFKDNPLEYEKAVHKLAQRVTDLKLNHVIEPLEFTFLLLTQSQPLLSNASAFDKDVDNLLRLKKTCFFFQLPLLVGFPDCYQLGHGKLRYSDSLPQTVKDFAVGPTKGRVGKVMTEQERIQTVFLREISVPTSPDVGCWLEINQSGISSFIVREKALRAAEESLDILRILRRHIRILLPQYAISKNEGDRKAQLELLKLELRLCHFDKDEHELIGRLNHLVVDPRSDLEKRILNAFHFYRVGRNFSPEDQELFYYVAAIENLVIGKEDREVLRWKFSEKAAFLLANDLNRRLEMVARLRDLYDARSTIAHGSSAPSKKTKDVWFARECVLKVAMEVLELVDRKGIKSVSPTATKKNDSLDEYIDQIKYSGANPLRGKRKASLVI